jgi:uncharacterized protein YbaR (Trm112 family)
MFIELTDHLRCPADHDEAYLILLPARMEGRLVREGVLGCPVCRREFPVRESVAGFGTPPPAPVATALTVEAALALLGLEGPGGYVVLVGGAGALAGGLAQRLPGVRFVLVNPPAGILPDETRSVLQAGRLPLKRSSMRGAVIAADLAADPAWLAATAGCVLPGLRLVAEGAAADLPGVEVLAEAGGWWVGTVGTVGR